MPDVVVSAVPNGEPTETAPRDEQSSAAFPRAVGAQEGGKEEEEVDPASLERVDRAIGRSAIGPDSLYDGRVYLLRAQHGARHTTGWRGHDKPNVPKADAVRS